MSIEESRHYIEHEVEWYIIEGTLEVIDKEMCMWVAEVTAPFLENNPTFFLLVEKRDYFIIELRWRHKLAAWFAKHL